MIIDFHAHIVDRDWLPDRWWAWLKNYYAQKRPLSARKPDHVIESFFDPKGEQLRDAMSDSGIDQSVILPLDWGLCLGEPKVSIRRQHELICDIVNQSQGTMVAFVGVDPRRSEALELTEFFIDKCGFKGIKLYPAAGFDLLSPQTSALFDFATEWHIPVLIHSGFSAGPFASKHGSPWYLDQICGNYPDLNIIAAHLGNGCFDHLCSIGSNKLNFHADISLMQQMAKHDTKSFAAQLRRAFDQIGFRNILFGSDWPFSEVSMSQQTYISILKQLQVNEEQSFLSQEITHLLGKNAYRLLSSPGGKRE